MRKADRFFARLAQDILPKTDTVNQQDVEDYFSERVIHGRRRAMAAISAQLLGDTAATLGVFRIQDDAESITQFIHGCRSRGVTAEQLLDLLDAVDDKFARYGVLLSLGEYGRDEIPRPRLADTCDRLVNWYRTDPSSTIHGAWGWLLRKWGFDQAVTKVDRTPLAYSPGREWFVQVVEVPRDDGTDALERLSFTFVVMPRGRFEFAGDPMRPESRGKQREIVLARPIAICDHEITWQQLMALRKMRELYDNMVRDRPHLKTGHPASAVTWYEAAMICRWLTKHVGWGEEEQCYADPATLRDADVDATRGACLFLSSGPPREWAVNRKRGGFRLPNRDEWEMACSAGMHTLYSFGSQPSVLKHYGWYLDNSDNRMQLGGQLRPSPRGLFDMYGNATEWCDNWHKTDRKQREFRGGGLAYQAERCRTARRVGVRPSMRDEALGFRLVLTLRDD